MPNYPIHTIVSTKNSKFGVMHYWRNDLEDSSVMSELFMALPCVHDPPGLEPLHNLHAYRIDDQMLLIQHPPRECCQSKVNQNKESIRQLPRPFSSQARSSERDYRLGSPNSLTHESSTNPRNHECRFSSVSRGCQNMK
jgi:hypothetical protein